MVSGQEMLRVYMYVCVYVHVFNCRIFTCLFEIVRTCIACDE